MSKTKPTPEPLDPVTEAAIDIVTEAICRVFERLNREHRERVAAEGPSPGETSAQ